MWACWPTVHRRKQIYFRFLTNVYCFCALQIDFEMFSSTKDCQSPAINNYCKLISKNLLIDWSNVTWYDLRKPLYSGLAALLYSLLKLNGTIMSDDVQQQNAFSVEVFGKNTLICNFSRNKPICFGKNCLQNILWSYIQKLMCLLINWIINIYYYCKCVQDKAVETVRQCKKLTKINNFSSCNFVHWKISVTKTHTRIHIHATCLLFICNWYSVYT